MFSLLEGAAAPVLEKIAQKRNLDLTDSERGALVQFVAFLAVRGPSFSDSQRNMYLEGYKLHLKTMAEHPEVMRKEFAKAGVTFDSQEEFEQTRDFILDIDNRGKMDLTGGRASFFKKAADTAMELTETLASTKSWHLLVANDERVFVTSDNPVTIQRPEHIPWHLAEGFIHGTILVTISPRVCLVMRSDPLRNEVHKIYEKDITYINRSVMKHAHRQVYSNLESRRIKQIRDLFQPGLESKVSAIKIKNTPYTMTRGLERDVESSIFKRLAMHPHP